MRKKTHFQTMSNLMSFAESVGVIHDSQSIGVQLLPVIKITIYNTQ
jgi:hypothetical protein